MKTTNAVEALKYVYEDGRTFRGVNDVFTFLTMEGFPVAYKTAARLDTEARNQLAEDGVQIQDPTSENNWTRTGLAESVDIARSRKRAIKYIKTFAKNLAAKLNVDANQYDSSAKSIQNEALIRKANEFIQALVAIEKQEEQ